MVDAQDRGAVKGYILDKLDETVLDLVEAAIMIEMLGIDIGDHRDRAVKPQEAAVAFVCLDDHPLTVAEAGVGTILVDDAAVDHSRVDTAGIEHRRDHRGRRRLPVGASDRNRRFQPHQLGQHFGPAYQRNPAGQRRFDFRIAALDGGRRDHHRCALNILRTMADFHVNALRAQTFDDIALGNIAALHLITEIVHNLGDAGHADAADADEMDRPDIRADALHCAISLASASLREASGFGLSLSTFIVVPSGEVPKLSTKSARSLTASGRPHFAAKRAAFSSAPGCSAIFCICLASSLAVKRDCGIARAPPEATISFTL